MPRVVSFIVLVGILLLIGSMFFKVMLQFVVPLFLASVLVVVFKPLHMWFRRRMPGKRRLAALATTFSILVTVLAPMAWLGLNSYREFTSQYSYLIPHKEESPKLQKAREELIPDVEARTERFQDWYTDTFGQPLDTKGMFERVATWGSGTLLSSFQVLIGLIVGLAIMVLALYYFLIDGDAMIETLMRLSPLDDEYERELLDKFANVSRAVVVASLLSAVAQGLLAGIGYYFALESGAPVFLLTAATMALAIVPFVGGAAIWIPTCLWIYFIKQDTGAAIGLAVYCAAIVSTVDNLIKPYVLHGQSNLHPLLALLSVLGGIQVLGPIGILVGPMLVAFIQAILNMLNKELKLMGDSRKKAGNESSGLDKAVALQAEAAVAAPSDNLLSSIVTEKPEAATPGTETPDTEKPAKQSSSKPKRKRRRKGS